jgi:hypothetical protein
MASRGASSRRWIKFLLGLAVVGLTGSGVAVVSAGGLREVLAGDPSKMDYKRLRQGLDWAEDLADRASRGTGRASTLAAARALERAILYSRSRARRTGTHPIPPEIRDQLEDYFPEYILDEVRWTYPNKDLDLGSAVAAWYGSEGGAVTLRDTIVFSPRNGAVASRYLWAHELTHALQYHELGMNDFARVYVTNPRLLERQAWDNADQIVLQLQRDARSAASEQARKGQASGSETPAVQSGEGEAASYPSRPS